MSSLFGDSVSAGSNDNKAKMELIKRQSSILIDELNEKKASGFQNYYALGEEIGQGMHATAYVCQKKSST